MKRLLALALVTAAGLLFLWKAPQAEARPPMDCITHYYSDSTYTTIVGWKHVNCSGLIDKYGTRTSYQKNSCESCWPWPEF